MVSSEVLQSVYRIDPGLAGTDQTVSRLNNLVDQAIASGRIRLRALEILQLNAVPSGDQAAAARVLYNWVRRQVRYIPDPVNFETIQQPEITYALRAGDCDDHSALLAALAESVGIPARFRVVGDAPNAFKHIWAELRIAGNWLPADTTNPAGFGNRPARFLSEKIYSRNGGGYMSGLSGAATTPLLPRRVLVSVAYNGALSTLKRNWSQAKINRDDLLGYLQTIKAGNGPGRGTFAADAMKQAITDFLAEVDRRGMVSGKPRTGLGGSAGLGGLGAFLGTVWQGVTGAVTGAVSSITGGLIGGQKVDGVDPMEGLTYGIGPDLWIQLGSGNREKIRHGQMWAPSVAAYRRGEVGILLSREPLVRLEPGQPLPTTTAAPGPGPLFQPKIEIPKGVIQTEVTPEAARAGMSEMLQSPVVIAGLGLILLVLMRKK